MAHVKEMTVGKPLYLILNFTIPLVLGNLLQQTYSLIDTAIVGRYLGINALAAVGASAAVTFLILGFCGGCGAGFGIPIAQKFGARDMVTMRRLVSVSLKLSVVMSVVIAFVTSLLCAPILRWMSTPESIMDDAYIYLLITFIGIPCTFLYNQLSSIIRALGDSKTPFLFLLLSTVMNILLDLLCIIVFGWGVAGAAVATVVSQGFSALLCYRYMYRKYPILRTEPEDRRFRPELAHELLAIGVPMGLQFSITSIGTIMLQSSNNALGTACMVAFTAGTRIKMVFLCMLESIGVTMATYTGQNFGAGKPERIWQGVRSAGKIMLVYVVVINFILWNYSEELAMLFMEASETDIIDKTVLYLHTTAVFYPVLGSLCILRYSIQGAGFTQFAMLSGVSEMLARGLVSVVAVPVWGYAAVCFGDPTAWIFANIFLIPAFVYVYRRLCRRLVTHENQDITAL